MLPLPKRGNIVYRERLFLAVGKALARNNRRLIYGGGSKGIMGVVSNTVVEEGGTVTGVIPYAMHVAGGEKAKTREEVEKPDEEKKVNGHQNQQVSRPFDLTQNQLILCQVEVVRVHCLLSFLRLTECVCRLL